MRSPRRMASPSRSAIGKHPHHGDRICARNRVKRCDRPERAARALRPLAVLRQQMPLLRLQQPCPRGDRPGGVARRAARRPRARGAAAARTDADFDLLRRRHALADGPPATVAAVHRCGATTLWASRRRHRDHARGQSLSVEAARFADLAAAGVNRLSLGLQSFDDDALAFLGRAHSAREGLAALDTAQAAFRARQLRPDLCPARRHARRLGRRARARAGASAPTHLSLYQLTIEPGTRFASDGRAGASSSRSMPTRRPRSVRADRRHDRQRPACRPTRSATTPGPAHESRHNLTYWRYGDYAGIGPGAHGRRLGMRTVRHRKPENFLSAARPQRPRHRRGGRAARRSRPATRRWSWACGSPRGSTPKLSRSASAWARSSTGRRVDRLVASGHLTRDGAHIATNCERPAAARPDPGRNRCARAYCLRLAEARTRASRAGWCGAAACGAAAAAGFGGASEVGHELIIVDRRPDVIVDRHVGIVGRSLARHSVLHPKADHRRPQRAQLSACTHRG